MRTVPSGNVHVKAEFGLAGDWITIVPSPSQTSLLTVPLGEAMIGVISVSILANPSIVISPIS